MTASVKAAMQSAAMAAMDVAEDVAAGRLLPAQLEAVVVAECRAVAFVVAGPDDPLWPDQVQVCRAVLALGGVPADELAEWAAVQRQAEGAEAVPVESWIVRALEQLDGGDDDDA